MILNVDYPKSILVLHFRRLELTILTVDSLASLNSPLNVHLEKIIERQINQIESFPYNSIFLEFLEQLVTEL